MIHRHDVHPPFRWFVEMHDGRLDTARAAEMREHLASGCARCGAQHDGVRRMVAAIAAGPVAKAPPHVDRRVLGALAKARRTTCRAASRDPSALVGSLVIDSRPELALSLRAPGDGTRHLLWTVGPWELDASVVSREGRADVLGQVVPTGDDFAPAPTGEVRIVRGRRIVRRALVASDGRFTFRNVEPGPCVLDGILDGRPFSLPPVVID